MILSMSVKREIKEDFKILVQEGLMEGLPTEMVSTEEGTDF